jgi:DNA polymerase-3 subunit delta'
MKFATYLEKHEPLAYKTLFEAAKNKRINHAYLLTGENGTPLMETATFFAKTILCQSPNPLADESCNNCERIDHGSYADLRVLGVNETSIKKEEVNALIDDFSQTARERKGIMVYIINLVENMTVEAVNSLLKFLEEPSTKTYAILTSQNPSRVLPTIISRCVLVRILPLSQNEAIADAINEGVKQEDAEILSYFVSSGDAIKEESQSPEFDKAKSAFIAALKGLGKGQKDAIYAFESEVIPLVSGKEAARYFFDMLSLAYKDLIANSLSRSNLLPSYGKLIEPLTRWVKSPQKDLETILHFRGEVELNINIPLLINEAGISLVKEWKHGN